MRTSWKSELPQLGIIAALFAWSAFLWPGAPETLPVHFDLSGTPDRFGSKLEGLFVVPALALGLYLLLRFLPRLDPMRANYPSFAGAYATLRLAVLLMLGCIDLILLLPMVGVPLNQTVLVRVITGGLLIVLGSVMGKIRPNWFVGIRTPWTLASKESWVKTHRLGGWAFVLAGLAFVLSAPLPARPALIMCLIALGAALVWTIVYSYLVWRGDTVRYPATGTRPELE